MATNEDYRLSVTYGAIPSNTVVIPTQDEEAEEFERFTDFASKLITVPKHEVDEKLKED